MANIFRSLRWRLQLWHATILLLVISGMVGVLSWEISRSHWDTIDEELVSAARLLEGSLRLVPQPILDSLSQDLTMPPGPRLPPDFSDLDRRPQRPPRFDPPGRRGFGPESEIIETKPIESDATVDWDEAFGSYSVPESAKEWEAKLLIPDALPRQIGRPGNQLYFVIWRMDNSILKQSALQRPVPNPTNEIRNQLRMNRYVAIQRGPYREVLVKGPHASLICVGRRISFEADRIWARQLFLALAGAITFGLGLAGGWWMSRNATAPITKMSETASKISANNLSNRMNLDGVDSELSDLGMVLNNMLDRLDQAFEQQKQFTADASHELRTPLAGLLATTELALAKERTPDEYRKHLQYCFINATRMQKLVEGLLVLARLDHHDASTNLEPIALMPILKNCVQATELIASEKQIHVHLRPIPQKVLGNANQLERVFTNLIENAIRYNQQGGEVWIESKMLGANVAISVRDNGQGIESSDQAKIMNRFFRVEAARTHSVNGYGLGLSIAKRIVDLHHGELGVESELGVGSTFTVLLPAYLEATN